MYPWHEALSAWAENSNLHVDALGLVTILGAEEIDLCVGRLVSSPYLEFLPLLGAYVIANDRFTARLTGFTMYNISAGIVTTELAGWFVRWLKAQDFRQVHSIVRWEVGRRPRRWTSLFTGFFLVGLPCNGMLLALTVLSGDWWGFATVVAMIASVAVRWILVRQNAAGIECNLDDAEDNAQQQDYGEKDRRYRDELATYARRVDIYNRRAEAFRTRAGRPGRHWECPPPPPRPQPPVHPYRHAKAIVVMDDAKVVTLEAPGYLIRHIFALNPQIPNPGWYHVVRITGWVAFAVHIVSIGMAALPTQICTVVVLAVATVLTIAKIGCDDFRLGKWGKTCWVSPSLSATVGDRGHQLPSSQSEGGVEAKAQSENAQDRVPNLEEIEFDDWTPDLGIGRRVSLRSLADSRHDNPAADAENGGSIMAAGDTRARRRCGPHKKGKPEEHRQDLYVQLQLSSVEEEYMIAWGLMPRHKHWLDDYKKKKESHRQKMNAGKEQVA